MKEAVANQNYDAEAIALANAANNIGNEVFEKIGFNFSKNFDKDCQTQSVPYSLICMVSLLLNGPNIKNQDAEESQACLSIAQLLLFNMKKRIPKSDKSRRNNREREPPLPVYVGLTVHAQMRSKILINQMNGLGISISYNRVDDILNGLATSLINSSVQEWSVRQPSSMDCLLLASLTILTMIRRQLQRKGHFIDWYKFIPVSNGRIAPARVPSSMRNLFRCSSEKYYTAE